MSWDEKRRVDAAAQLNSMLSSAKSTLSFIPGAVPTAVRRIRSCVIAVAYAVEDQMNHQFNESALATLYPDGTIFLGTVAISLSGDEIEWRLPFSLRVAARERLCDLSHDEIQDPVVHLSLGHWLDQLLEMPSPVIRWKLSFSYCYTQNTVKLLDAEPAIYNQDLPDKPMLQRLLQVDNMRTLFLEQKYSAGVVVGEEVVSVCYHEGNGAVTVATKPRFRRHGFGSSCLRVLTKKSIEDKIRLGYGTEARNLASIRTAESVGYTLDAKMFWIVIPAEKARYLPATLRRELAPATFG